MSLPHISLLKKISELEHKIIVLTQELDTLQARLDETVNFYKTVENNELNKLVEMYTQEKVLLQIKSEIQVLREQENSLRQDLNQNIHSSLNKFLSPANIQKLIELIIKKESKNTSEIKVLASADMSQILEKYKFDLVDGSGKLTIEAGSKAYILDQSVLISQLTDKLFIKLLSSQN